MRAQGRTPARQPCVTCLAVLKKSSEEAGSVGMLVVGAENGEVRARHAPAAAVQHVT